MTNSTILDWTGIPQLQESTKKEIKSQPLRLKLTEVNQVEPVEISKLSKKRFTKRDILWKGVVPAVAVASISLLPDNSLIAFAQENSQHLATSATGKAVEDSGWQRLIDKFLWMVDYLMDGIIIFAGVSWMLGNRSRAIELLIGAGLGYLIVRHYDDIKMFFQLI